MPSSHSTDHRFIISKVPFLNGVSEVLRAKCLTMLPPAMVIITAFGMVFLAQWLGHPEIMLPTLGALMTGAWLVSDNLWHYSRRHLALCPPLAAITGTILSNLVCATDTVFMYPALYVAFLLTALILIFSRTQIYPCFGAATLPILFHTTSWVYPLSVTVMALSLCAGRTLLEHTHCVEPLKGSGFSPLREKRRVRIAYYLQTSLGLLPALILVPCIGDHYLLLPPMFVTYATFCNQHSSFTQCQVKTWAQISLAIVTSSLLSLVMGFAFDTELTTTTSQALFALGAGLSVAVTALIGKKAFHKLFPPAMSFALTPFFVHFNPWLMLYVPVMCAYFIFIAWLMRNHPTYANGDLHYI